MPKSLLHTCTFVVCLIFSFKSFSQNYQIQDGVTINSCTGNFYDTGGVAGNYANDESITFTICPDTAGLATQLDFSSWDIGDDQMTVYNGPDNTYDVIGNYNVTNPGQLRAVFMSTVPGSIPNPTGCLTVEFNSDADTIGAGWQSVISCYEPCQTITAQIDTTLPLADANDIIRICQGDEVTFDGSGIFSDDGTGGAFELSMGDGVSITGGLTNDEFSANYTFNDTGIYEVSLVIYDDNPLGCSSINNSMVYVYVSSTPDFTGTEAADASICFGEETTIEGVVNPVIVSTDCANGGEETFLADIVGTPFTSTLDLDCFSGQTFTDISQLESICIIMEHTYIGDLVITVISPDGTRVQLVNRAPSNPQNNLGDPITTDGTGPGTGWEYCFSMSAADFLYQGPTELAGTPVNGLSIQAGEYRPVGNFNDFLGNQIDGQWTLEIVDNEAVDDGTIFSWSLNFDESLLSTDYSFTPVITNESWDADPSITATAGNTITIQPTTAGTHCYTYRAMDDFGCEYTEEVCVEVFPEVTAIRPTPFEICVDPISGQAVYDLTIKDDEVTGGDPNLLVEYFEYDTDVNNNNPIVPATAYTGSRNLLFIRVTDLTTGCINLTEINLVAQPYPNALNDANSLVHCDDNNPGDNQEVFDLTENEIYILNGEADVSATYYTDETDAHDGLGVNEILNPTTYVNQSLQQPIYVRVTNDITGCYTVVDFDIIVNPLPLATTVTNLFNCETNADGLHQFNLDSKTDEILNGQSIADFEVTYHTSQADADTGNGDLTSPYENDLGNPQPIYVRIENRVTGCSNTTMNFDIEEIDAPIANANMAPYVLCDNYEANDGIAQFDLTTQDGFVLNGLDPLVFEVSYYYSQADADAGVNPLPDLYVSESNSQFIYARVDNTVVGNVSCSATAELELMVNLLPDFSLNNEYTLCVNTNGTEVTGIPLIETGLSELDYTFEWSLDGNVIVGATGTSYVPVEGGGYSVTATDIVTGCSRMVKTTVNESSPPIVTATVSSLAFANNNVIEVETLGSGTYEYSLDNGPWQESNVFENVSLGEHTVMVRDLNGCGYDSTTIMVMDYPKYFTPNGDGIHDTWNISGIDLQPNARIYVYDRFGKLLKQLSPTGNGWNGTFNGYNLPAADYWFTIQYIEPSDGSVKQFKAHFALKR